MFKFISFLLIALILSSCQKDPQIIYDAPVYDIDFVVPKGWPQPKYNFENNTLTEDGFRLGRKLFYETLLSRDNSISCGTCHQQFAAFAHKNHVFSHGVDGKLGNRNSPPLFNLNWHPSFMWDGGINHLEVQPFGPITNPIEMDESLSNVVAKLSADEKYRRMFKRAFGDDSITTQRLSKALAQFMGMMNSSNSKYDQYMKNETSFSERELEGLKIFRANCATCHTEPLFSDFSIRDNGLPVNPNLNDSGRYTITKNPQDLFKFKVPSLRNLDYSEHFMHDGSMKTLNRVLEHYEKGIEKRASLDPILANGIKLTNEEKTNLVAFLKTLNDDSFVKDPRFSELMPF